MRRQSYESTEQCHASFAYVPWSSIPREDSPHDRSPHSHSLDHGTYVSKNKAIPNLMVDHHVYFVTVFWGTPSYYSRIVHFGVDPFPGIFFLEWDQNDIARYPNLVLQRILFFCTRYHSVTCFIGHIMTYLNLLNCIFLAILVPTSSFVPYVLGPRDVFWLELMYCVCVCFIIRSPVSLIIQVPPFRGLTRCKTPLSLYFVQSPFSMYLLNLVKSSFS